MAFIIFSLHVDFCAAISQEKALFLAPVAVPVDFVNLVVLFRLPCEYKKQVKKDTVQSILDSEIRFWEFWETEKYLWVCLLDCKVFLWYTSTLC